MKHQNSPKLNLRATFNSSNIGCAAACIYLTTFWLDVAAQLALTLLSLTALLSLSLFPRNYAFAYTMTDLLLGLFVALSLLSAALGSNPLASLARSVSFLPGILLYVIISRTCNRVEHIVALSFSLTIVATALALSTTLVALYSGLSIPTEIVSALRSPTLVVPNDIAIVSIVAPLSIASLRLLKVPLLTLLALCSLGLFLVAIDLLQSRGAFITIFVALLAISVARRRRMALGSIILLVGSGIIIDALGGGSLIAKFSHLPESRLSLNLAAFHMFLASPPLGHGPHTFGELWRSYLPTSNTLEVDAADRYVPWAHNLFFELLAERGLLATLIFAGLVVRTMRALWQLIHRSANVVPDLSAALFASMIAFVTAAVFELTFLHLWVVLIWLTLTAMTESLGDCSSEEAEHTI